MAVVGGQKLEGLLNHIASAVMGEPVLKVGFLSNATYPARPTRQLRAAYARRRAKGIAKPIKGADVGTLNVATVAFWNEYGTRFAPPRPFFRTMIRNKSGEWGLALAIQLQRTKFDVRRSMNVLGEGIAGQLRESIINMNSPPNAASTIARKGHSKVLVDTAHMLMSIDHEIV